MDKHAEDWSGSNCVVFENLLASLVFPKLIFAVCNVWDSPWEIYLFYKKQWFCHSKIVSQISKRIMSCNLRVCKQSELASRDTTSSNFLYEINSAGSRPWDGGWGGGGGGRHQDPYKRGGGLQKIFFRSVCVKIRGGGWAPRSPPLDPSLINTYGLWHHQLMNSTTNKRGKASLVYC